MRGFAPALVPEVGLGYAPVGCREVEPALGLRVLRGLPSEHGESGSEELHLVFRERNDLAGFAARRRDCGEVGRRDLQEHFSRGRALEPRMRSEDGVVEERELDVSLQISDHEPPEQSVMEETALERSPESLESCN